MRRCSALLVFAAMVAGPVPAADGPRSRPVDRPTPLSEEARAELRALLKRVELLTGPLEAGGGI